MLDGDSQCHLGTPVLAGDPQGHLETPKAFWAPFQCVLGTPSVTWSPQYWLGKPNTIQDCEQELNPQFRLGPQFLL